MEWADTGVGESERASHHAVEFCSEGRCDPQMAAQLTPTLAKVAKLVRRGLWEVRHAQHLRRARRGVRDDFDTDDARGSSTVKDAVAPRAADLHLHRRRRRSRGASERAVGVSTHPRLGPDDVARDLGSLTVVIAPHGTEACTDGRLEST